MTAEVAVKSQNSTSIERVARSESGLTTLEWLLIVAAVAGLAALAVVLVQNVVDETAEEISGNNARITAARVAAARITSDAREALPSSTDSAWINTTNDAGQISSLKALKAKQDSAEEEYSSKCDRLEITYSDATVSSDWKPIISAALKSDGKGYTNKGTTSDKNNANVLWTAADSNSESEAYCEISTQSP